jgi:hypothetical protein
LSIWRCDDITFVVCVMVSHGETPVVSLRLFESDGADRVRVEVSDIHDVIG